MDTLSDSVVTIRKRAQPSQFAFAPTPWEIFQMAAIVVIVSATIFLVIASQPPHIATPVRPPLPKINGFDALRAAHRKLIHLEVEKDPIYKENERDWSFAKKRALIEQNQPAILATRAALRLTYWDDHDSASIFDSRNRYADFRSLVRVLRMAGDVALHEHRTRAAAEYFLDAITVGMLITHGALEEGRRDGIACEAIGRHDLWSLVSEMDLYTAKSCLHRLNALQSDHVPLWDTIAEEKYFEQRGVANEMEHPSKTSDDDGPPEPKSEDDSKSRTGLVYLAFKNRIVNDIGDYKDESIRRAKMPYSTGSRPQPEPKDPFAGIAVSLTDGLRFYDTLNDTADALLRTVLALRIYQLQTGHYPATLAVLVDAKLLDAAPTDYFAASGPLTYRQVSPSQYLLYSIGPDGKDDHGQPIFDPTKGRGSRNVFKESTGDIVAGWCVN